MKGEHSIVAAVHVDRSNAVDRKWAIDRVGDAGRRSTTRSKSRFSTPNWSVSASANAWGRKPRKWNGTNQVKRKMIKRIMEYGKPKIWCPREDYYLPQDGISMSVTSAFPSPNSETSEIAIYRSTGVKREDDGTFVLQPSKATIVDAKCHRYINIKNNWVIRDLL